jgi:cell division transport system permease protein
MVSIALVLFLLGLILITFFLGNELSHYVKENITLSAVLAEDLSDRQIRKIQDDLNSQPYVRSTEYISKEQASLEMQRELGENPETFLGFNPFRASIEIKLKSEYTHPDSFSLMEKQISSEAGILEVQYRKDMMQMVNRNIRRIGIVLFSLFIVLIAISFVLINNTIRLLIYSKRFLIYTMRLVGATPAFIRWPFIRQNIVSGLLSGLMAVVMLMGSLYCIKHEFLGLEEVLNRNTLWFIYGMILVSGILLSVIAVSFAVNRYLRMTREMLHYI